MELSLTRQNQSMVWRNEGGATFHLGSPSTGKWSGRGPKSHFGRRNEETTGQSWRELGERDTPFALVYENDAIILIEVGLSTHVIDVFSQQDNDEVLMEELDLVYERNERVNEGCRNQRQWSKLLMTAKSINKDSRLESWCWNKVITVLSGGAYELANMEGKYLSTPWNINHLKKIYIWNNGAKNPRKNIY